MSGQRDDGGTAFPADPEREHSGMSLRDYYAGQALIGLMGREWGDPKTGAVPDDIQERWAKGAFLAADAMVARRKA